MKNLNDAINSRRKVIKTIQALLVENLNLQYSPDEIHPDTPLFNTGLGLDSIDAVEIIVLIESEFGCVIEDGNISAMRNINSIADYVLTNTPVTIE